MKSPVHPDTQLAPKEIEPGLSVYHCPKSGGVWIPQTNYLAWKETHPQPASPLAAPPPPPADDSQRGALVCPECGRLLIRYKVGHGLKFKIDLSPATGGVWLDCGKWEALKSKNLHTELNFIATPGFQFKIRAAEYEEKMEQSFRDRIGSADFARVVSFKDWLLAHPKRADICSYLLHHIDPKKNEPTNDEKSSSRFSTSK
jgi:Zn-finger nucleic acid-binding protein